MAKLLGEMLFFLIRLLVLDLLSRAALRWFTWLDTAVQNRKTKLAISGLLGLAAYFVFPILMGLLAL